MSELRSVLTNKIATTVAAMCCGVAAVYSLSLRWILSGHWYRAHRYSGFGGGIAALIDSIVIFVAAATLGAQLTYWLLTKSQPQPKWRWYIVGATGVVVVYLFFVANFGQ